MLPITDFFSSSLIPPCFLQEKTAETKKVKKDENGAGEEEEEVEDEGEELEGEDEEYDLPYGDEEDIEAEGKLASSKNQSL